MADTVTCQVSVNWDDKPPLCALPAVGAFAAACVHEHVFTSRVCAPDAAEIQRTGQWFCQPCRDSAQPHKCPITLTWTWAT
jgi:hypothetical protein